MKSFVIFCLVLICCLCLAYAAPADDGKVSTQFLKYKNDQEFEEIQKQIIAQYDQLGGSSQFHQVQTQYVDPHNIKINL